MSNKVYVRVGEQPPVIPKKDNWELLKDNVEELFTELFAQPPNKPVETLKKALTNMGVNFKVSWEKNGRIIVSFDRNAMFTKKNTSFMSFAVNGLVLLPIFEDTENPTEQIYENPKGWQVISVPPFAFNPKVNYKEISANFGKYKAYAVNDGTTITLYHYQGSWRISTARAFDATYLKWVSDLTYMENFLRLSKAYSKDILAELDSKKCYSFGIRVHAGQPLLLDPENVWFIQAVDLESLKPAENQTSIPSQKMIEIGDGKCLQDLVDINNKSLNAFLSNKSIHYGFILRGNYSSCGNNFNIYLESELMKKIRNLYYNVPKEIMKSGSGIHMCMVINAYLGYMDKKLFTDLFPQFKPDMDAVEDLIFQIKTKIIQKMRNKNIRLIATIKPANRQQIIDNCVFELLKDIEKQKYKINPYDTDVGNIVMDFICDKGYWPKYLAAMNM